jgi:DNA repair protein RecO (recombination protein O)
VFKTRGIVLKERDAGESDKILVLLTKEYGRLSVSVRGARRPKSKFMAGAQLFTYSDFVIYNGKSFYAMAQMDMIENFYALRADYAKLCYGHYFLELCEKTILENTPCDDILFLLVRCLSVLARGLCDPSLAARIFEFKFFQLYGLAPEAECCSVCGAQRAERMFFGPDGLVCEKCRPSSYIPISSAALYAIRYIYASPVNRLFQFTLADAPLLELKKAARLFLSRHFDISLKSLEVFDE